MSVCRWHSKNWGNTEIAAVGVEGAHRNLLQAAAVEKVDGHACEAAKALLSICSAASVEVGAVAGHALSSHRLCAVSRGGT